MTTLDLFADPVDLTAALVDIESPSHHEEAIADAIEQALRGLEHAQVERFGNTVVARTIAGRDDLRIEHEPFSTSPVVRRRTLGVD